MISSPLFYLFTLVYIALFFNILEKKSELKLFKYLPPVVLIYALSMLLAGFGVFEKNSAIDTGYSLAKANLLPAMLFLMLLKIDFSHFFRLGKSLLIAYVLTVISLACGFILVSVIFNFNHDMAVAFGALSGSWFGGTANMVAVGSALGVTQEAYGFVLIVDSVNYTFWVMFLLFLVPFAPVFDRFVGAKKRENIRLKIDYESNKRVKRYPLLLIFAVAASLLSQEIAQHVEMINSTTMTVLVATLFGIIGSFTRLKNFNGSSEVATMLLYMLIALIGSKAVFESFSSVGIYVFAGFMILVIHTVVMVISAKIFKLDLFSITVASLANIGGVASAPILAAAYNKSLVSVGVLMAVMGYLIGTFGGLLVGNIMVGLAK
ncbi:MAG: DUF819 family protein [Campylobacterales bacterium]|nr:DUF819 family protein [Campylobacterales bacterium]